MNRAVLIFGALLAIALPLSLLAGRVWIDFAATPNAALILAELRLPRSLLAIIVGAGLGAAGAAMQGYLRNPLADPGLFGIAPGAALGAVLALWFGYAASPYLLPLFALVGAGGAMALLALIAGRTGGIALFTLAGLMVASLAGAAGAAMQGYLRNPLADPGLFGIAPCAALGAVVALWFGYAASPYLLPLFALVGAGGAMALLALIAGRTGGIALFTLAGLMVASLAGALTALAISLAPNAFAMSEIVLWLNGALTDRSWREVWIAAPLVTLGIAVLFASGKALDALTLGEDVARSLGVNPASLLWLLIAGVGLTVGASVAVAGIIGFVGLIVPHLVRPLTDRRPSQLLLPSALAGALLVLVADSLVRILPLVTELRLGIALSLLGAPFFLWLLLRMRRGAL